MLYQISFSIELTALLMSIGLGVYLVTHNVHKAVAWLAACTCWSMGGLFLNMLFSMAPPPIPVWLERILIFWPRGVLAQQASAWLQGWTSTLAPVIWFHATMLMRPMPVKSLRWLAIFGAYIAALVVIGFQVLAPTEYTTINGDPLYLNALQPGPIYGLSLTTMVLVCGLIIRNLILAARAEPRSLPHSQLLMLSAATILAGLTGPVGLMAAFFNIHVPMFLIALLIGAGVLVTGLGVAFYSSLMESRIFLREFGHTAMVTCLMTLLYLWLAREISLIHPFPIFVYVLVGVVAVVSHTLVDAIRQNLDFSLFRREKHLLRERLHSLDNPLKGGGQTGLDSLLERVCKPIQAGYAVLLIHRDGKYVQAAGYHWQPEGLELPADSLTSDDLRLLRPGQLPPPLAKAACLVPVYLGDQQVGALVLGAAEHGLAYSLVELDGLQELSDYVGVWLGRHSQPENAQPGQVEQSTPPDVGIFQEQLDGISSRTVELGLRCLHDYARLAELPLAETRLIHSGSGGESRLETGKAVHGLLCQAVEWLRPPASEQNEKVHGVPRREWFPYIILHDAYVNSLPNREIMNRLYISEGTFNRTRRSAIRCVARQLMEMESSLPR